MIAEMTVERVLASEALHSLVQKADHAADLLGDAGRLIADFGIGQNPETGEAAIKFAERWYTAEQWAKGLGTRETGKAVVGSVVDAVTARATAKPHEPEEDQPKYLKDLTLKLAYGDAHIPFQIWADTDGVICALPVAENAGGLSYKLDIEGDGSLEWPMLRGLDGGGKKGPFDLGEYDLIGCLIREARVIEMDRLRRLGILDDNGELYEAVQFVAIDGEPDGTRTIRPGEAHRYPRLSKEVSIASRVEWFEQYGRSWAEDEAEIPVKFHDGRIESVLASEIS